MKRFMHRVNALLALSLLINPVLAHTTIQKPATSGVSYNIIRKLLSSSMIQNPEQNREENKDTKKIILEIPQLTELDKIAITSAVLNQTEPASLDNHALLNVLKETEIFQGNSNKTIFDKINHTVTIFGKTELAHMLANPESLKVLQQRQAFIKELVTNEELFNNLESLLQEVQTAEKGIFSFWKEENQATKDYLEKQLFFNKNSLKQFNSNAYALEALIRLDNTGTIVSTAFPFLIFSFFNYMALKSVNPHCSFGTAVKTTPQYLKRFYSPSSLKTIYQQTKENALVQAEKIKQQTLQQYPQTNPKYLEELPNKMVKASLVGATSVIGIINAVMIFGVLHAKSTLTKANQTKKAINYLHTKLIDVATFVNACKKLVEMSNNNHAFSQGWNSKDSVENILIPTQTPFSTLLQLLQTKTFKGKASFFSLSGRVLAAHELMKTHKDELGGLFKALGEIDAYMSIAKLYKKYQNERVHYNFVNFVTAAQPALHIQGFWHPLIPTESAITNDVSLGYNAPSQNIILTGSNTAGKSTLLKSILLAQLLGTTLTLGAFQEMTTTYFDILGSYLQMTDDIGNGNSLFKAEVLRAQSLLDNAQKLGSDKFGFVVIDELFTGTSADKGSQAAYKVAERLANLPNVIFILATHFPQLTELEKNSKGSCKNYKIEALKQEDGTIVRPFKLEPGISTVSIANDILQNELTDIDFSI
jgi:DNA mismatch repair protein MutS